MTWYQDMTFIGIKFESQKYRVVSSAKLHVPTPFDAKKYH